MRLQKRSMTRPPLVRPLKPWLLAAGLVVSFTANAGIRTNVDPATPGLRFDGDPANVSLAWPTLTAPDIAAITEDFIAARPPLTPEEAGPEANEEPQFQPGFWRGAQPSDGQEPLSEATPEISVLFRLGSDIMPPARAFEADDGGPIIGAFSGLVEPSSLTPQIAQTPPIADAPQASAKPLDTITVAKVLPTVIAVALAPTPATIKIALAPARPVPPRSPLVGVVTSEKELKCLAEAVYFESRSEPERGQAGVAQVVLNRVRSGAYPASVCGVVYQNRHRYLACQFTFACEGKSLRPTESGSWSTAMRIARDVSEGRTYLPGVGNATHYHANYVRPWWARHMDKREKVGKHLFYFEAAEN